MAKAPTRTATRSRAVQADETPPPAEENSFSGEASFDIGINGDVYQLKAKIPASPGPDDPYAFYVTPCDTGNNNQPTDNPVVEFAYGDADNFLLKGNFATDRPFGDYSTFGIGNFSLSFQRGNPKDPLNPSA